MAPSVPLLEVRDLYLAYGDREVVHGLSFALERGSIGCLPAMPEWDAEG